MYNIHIRIQDQIAKIVIGSNLFLHQILAQFQVVLIYIADCHQTGAAVVQMSATHTAGTNDTFCQLVTRGNEALTQHLTGNDGEQSDPTHCL